MITRVRGDNYPITATIKLNGTIVDLTGAIVTFSYYESTNVRTIAGTITTPSNGIVTFLPSASDFQLVGNFPFDIQRVQGGYTYTHLKGSITITDDVTK